MNVSTKAFLFLLTALGAALTASAWAQAAGERSEAGPDAISAQPGSAADRSPRSPLWVTVEHQHRRPDAEAPAPHRLSEREREQLRQQLREWTRPPAPTTEWRGGEALRR